MTRDNDDSEQRRSVPTDPDAGTWTSLEAWKALPSDPDLNREFGYELTDWDIITQGGMPDQMVFLPADPEALADDAFIVADEEAVCDVENRK